MRVSWIWMPGILVFPDERAEGGSPFHAHEDEVDSELILVLPTSQLGTDVVLLADPFFGPLHRDVAFQGEGFHPAVVIVGRLRQDVLAEGVDFWRSRKKGTRFSGRVSQDR